MRRLVFVTGNAGKFAEAKARLDPLGIELVQDDLGLPELQADDLETVARWKAEVAAGSVRGAFMLEDAGLFVRALGGFPGVYSAYAFRTIGCDGLLRLLRGRRDRRAEFRAVIALREPGRPLRIARGAARGRIPLRARGDLGFGFDPVFAPDARPRVTFGELGAVEKNRVSHRGRALDALVRLLSRRAAKPRRGNASL